jgi:aerobic carbon-monoxide dehydrogenase small subunit
MKSCLTFVLNGEKTTLSVDPMRTLLSVLREDCGLTGTKDGCGEGDCGACTVLLNGSPVNSCLLLMGKVDGSEVTTIEGMSTGDRLHPLQEAFLTEGAVQCGYCTPGMLLSAKALLDRNPDPTDQQMRESIAGNLCRCTGYAKIVQAIKAVVGDARRSPETTPPIGPSD